MADKNKQLVLALFDSEVAADKAVESLKSWDKATEAIKLGAIGVLVKDENGKIKDHKLGKRDSVEGAGVGLVLGIIAAVLSGGITLLGGIVGGAILGGVVGTFIHKGLGMSKEDLEKLGAHLDVGRAAVGVMVEKGEVKDTAAKLTELGGKIETYEVKAEALQDVTKAGAAATAATAATTAEEVKKI
ncbi:MAG TPA: hypothetical protein VLB04_06300 [Methanotrichaceae archaeon]|nr:hypothetical protein [Methanotrichaceae archaeon]